MRIHQVEPRNGWHQKTRDCGLTFGNGHTHCRWSDSRCVELTPQDAEALYLAGSSLYDAMMQHTEEIVSSGGLAHGKDSFTEMATIMRSWEDSDYFPTLFTRFELSISPDGDLALCEISSDPSTLLLESALVQWNWFEERVPWAIQYNTITERLIEIWPQYSCVGRPVFFLYPAHDQQRRNVAEYLWDCAKRAGVIAYLTASDEVHVNETDQQAWCEGHGRIDLAVIVPSAADLPLANVEALGNQGHLCVIEPPWKTIWKDRAIVDAFRSAKTAGIQLPQLTIDSDAVDTMRCNIWVIAGEVSGVGITQCGRSMGVDVPEFLPHLIAA